eukprot:31135-Pelagococcus_subviridis.AAC.8
MGKEARRVCEIACPPPRRPRDVARPDPARDVARPVRERAAGSARVIDANARRRATPSGGASSLEIGPRQPSALRERAAGVARAGRRCGEARDGPRAHRSSSSSCPCSARPRGGGCRPDRRGRRGGDDRVSVEDDGLRSSASGRE